MNTTRNALVCVGTIATITVLFSCLGPASAATYTVTMAGEDGAEGCTIGVANGHATMDGRPIMWKVRDWNGRQGVFHHPGNADYAVACIFQGNLDGGVGAGVNSAGVATGNSNVGSGGANWDVMSDILGRHANLEEVRRYWPSQSIANGCFPVIDANGNAVMFEGFLSEWRAEYDSMDPDREAQGLYGFVVRANELHRKSDGTDDQNIGGRYASGTYNVLGLVATDNLSVKTLIQGDEGPNRGYEFARYGPGPDRPLAAISRDSNIATIVVHGVLPGEDPASATMWVILGQSNYGIAVPAWVKVSEIPACLANGDMYDRATSLWTKRNEAATQASVFPLEAHFFDTVLDTLLPHWRVTGVSAEEMKRVEHQFAADAYSLLYCLDKRQADNHAPQVDFDVFSEDLTFLYTLAAYDVDGSLATISWDFGDGYTSAEHSPLHTYAIAGTYLISCTVTDDDGVSATRYRYSLDPASLPPVSIENTRTGEGHVSIASAVWEAESGDVLVLSPGTYCESIRVVGKALTLKSLDPNDPLVVAATSIQAWDGIPPLTFSGPESAGSMLDGLTIFGGTVAVSCCEARPMIARCTIRGDGPIAVEFWEGYEPIIVDCNILGEVVQWKDPRIVAHWKLDETAGTIAQDSAGENDATVIGGPLWQPEGGRVGGALRFDGVDDYVRTGFVVDPSKDEFSVFAWIRGGAPGQVLVSQQGDGANWLMASTPDGTLMTDLKSAGRQASSLTSEIVITDDQWHQVGVIWDGINRTLYVDDIKVAEDAEYNLRGSTGDLCIGAGSTLDPSTFWSGLIDDVRIYNRAVKP
ncbi:MAG: PKD domain-containing protein [Phycisphaerae bacterium]|nr:PKD domain-containing protein [Phycisphaerae bacterium]